MPSNRAKHINSLVMKAQDFAQKGQMADAISHLVIAVGYQQDEIRDLNQALSQLHRKLDANDEYQREQNEY